MPDADLKTRFFSSLSSKWYGSRRKIWTLNGSLYGQEELKLYLGSSIDGEIVIRGIEKV